MKSKTRKIIESYIKNNEGIILPPDSDKILNFYKISTPLSFLVQNLNQALNLCSKLRFPLVIKIISPLFIHKTKVKGVIFVNNKKELREKFSFLYKKFKHKKLKGILIQQVIPKGKEYILGGFEDKVFGKIVMFGLGGVFVEQFKKISFRLPPLNLHQAKDMVKEITENKQEINCFAKTILHFCKLLCQNKEIKEIDLNPIIIYKNKVYSLDSRIILAN